MRIVYELPPLGEGGVGRVYAARTLDNEPRAVALKKTRHSDYVEHPPLLHEACGLALAYGHASIPEVFGWGRSQYYEYLATELLGRDLATKFRHEPLTRRNFVSLVLQMFAAVEHVHSCGILHCDIKPDNFLLGTGSNSGRVYLIHFNLWAPWSIWNAESQRLKPIGKDRAAKGFRGTLRYASIDCHLDRVLSRKDDIESLAYTIFELYASKLPRSHRSDDELEEIVKSKQAWNMVPGLLQGSCDYPLGHFADYARSLEFDSDPDYEYWRRAFWTVDNPTAPLPESDPLYDPDDDSEQLPRNMMFITEGPGGRVLHYKLPPKPNAGRMYSTFSSDQAWIPVSDGWSGPYTMLERDTLDDELGIVRQYVDLITEPPTTTQPYLDGQCAPEEMRDFEDPLPFKCVEERRDRGVAAKRLDAGNGEASEKAGTKDSAEEGDETKERQPGVKEAKESVTDEENEEGVNSENRKEDSE